MKKYTPFPIFQEAGRFHDKTTIYNFDNKDKSALGLRKVGGVEREHMSYGAGILHRQGKLPNDLDAVRETKIMKDIKRVKERR